MDVSELEAQAVRNREVFERALPPYVSLKLENTARALEEGARAAWLDASGCVWCLFDDPAFVRCGNEATELRQRLEEAGETLGFQLFWSIGDVVMPRKCDASWVAGRIVDEAQVQLRARGLRCRAKSREVDGETHQGVLFSKSILGLR